MSRYRGVTRAANRARASRADAERHRSDEHDEPATMNDSILTGAIYRLQSKNRDGRHSERIRLLMAEKQRRMSRMMEGTYILTYDPTIATDPALGHDAEGWDRAVCSFEYATFNWPEQRERVGETDRIAVAVVEHDGDTDTYRGRSWEGRAVVLTPMKRGG